MGDRSAIEWTDASWNPVRARRTLLDGTSLTGWHCEHVSEGCRNCYAEGFNRRLGTKLDYKPGHLLIPQRPTGEVVLFLDEKMLLQPLRWRAPRKIFVGSMTDVFADFVTDEWLDRMFAVMALCPQHVFQVLTKRLARMRRYLTAPDVTSKWMHIAFALHDAECLPKGAMFQRDEPLPNVWLGTSIEDRAALIERAGHLRKTPAAVRFFSCEPLIGDLGQVVLDDIDWVICGGESGPNARPMHPDWARSLRDQCAAAGVPFFFKQWGEWKPTWGSESHLLYHDGQLIAGTHDHPDAWQKQIAEPVWRPGKKRAGRELDGVEHNGMPGVPA